MSQSPMARGKPPQNDQPSLTCPREEARAKLEGRIEEGRRLLAASPPNPLAAGGASEADYNKWNDFNHELLLRLFTTNKYAGEYGFALHKAATVPLGRSFRGGGRPPWQAKVQAKIEALESIIHVLDLIPEPEASRT